MLAGPLAEPGFLRTRFPDLDDPAVTRQTKHVRVVVVPLERALYDTGVTAQFGGDAPRLGNQWRSH